MIPRIVRATAEFRVAACIFCSFAGMYVRGRNLRDFTRSAKAARHVFLKWQAVSGASAPEPSPRGLKEAR